MTGITLFDSIENGQFPPGGAAYAGYVDGHLGNQPNYAWVVSAFPHAHHLSIALFGGDRPHVGAPVDRPLLRGRPYLRSADV
jgi:hypothetical protein